MKKRLRFILLMLCFALFVQTFYPAYQININLSEIIENAEESANIGIKKIPLYFQENVLLFSGYYGELIGKRVFKNYEDLQTQYYHDIWVPPPRV